MFSVDRDGRSAAVALATQKRSFRNRELIFPSYPRWIESNQEVSGKFWQGLKDYCSKNSITHVLLNSYEASAPQKVPFGDPASARERQEYYVDLRPDLDSIFKNFSSNHRRNIRKGERQEFSCDIDSSVEAFEQHLSVFSHTQTRRAERDESAAGINASLCRHLLASGDGWLMQLRHANETISSFLILVTPNRAFYYSGGTTKQGMRLGASHYLMWLVIKELKDRGISSLSLGGISSGDPEGLVRYKLGFGTTAVPLVNSVYDTKKEFGDTSLQVVRRVKRRLAAAWGALNKIIRFKRWVLFSWNPLTVREASVPSGLNFRPLCKEDFAAMQECEGRLADQARLYYRQRGITSAFGLFSEDRLVHISWVYTAEEYSREPLELIKLGEKEAEITNCFTLDEFRGKGLYPIAIGCISKRLFEQGVERVYMKTTPDNIASQKGIKKAGLKPSGTSCHISSPALSVWKGWYFCLDKSVDIN